MPQEPSPEFPIIPDHTIVRELGRGGMATVYLAIHDELKRSVAIKVMEAQAGVSRDFVARFVREGQTVANLRHPHIVTIYHSNYKCAKPYIVMEYLPGGSLTERIRRGLTPEQAVAFLRCIAQALGVAHRAGIIHRDIKPQNILFRDDDTPVLTDFGIARDISDPNATQLTQVGMVVGSPRYMSPEQSMAQPLDARSDLYSLGVVFYEMLTGEPPYRAQDVISLAMKHCSAPLPVLPPTQSRYQPILERLLAKTPAERFRSTDALIAALDELNRTPAVPIEDDEFVTERTVVRSAVTLAATAPRPHPALSTPREPAAELPAPAAPPPPSPPVDVTREATQAVASPPPVASPSVPPRSRWPWTFGGLVIVLALAGGWWFYAARAPHLGGMLSGTEPTRSHPARAALERGNLAESLRLTRDGLAVAPDDPQLRALQIELLAQLNAERSPEAALALANDLLAEGLLAEAESVITRGLQQVPEHARLRDLQALVQRQAEQARAERLAQWRAEAERAVQRGDLTAALAVLDRALAVLPHDSGLRQEREQLERQVRQSRAEALLQQARTALAEHDLATALRLSREGLTHAPERRELIELTARIEASLARERELHEAIATATARIAAQALDDGLRVVEAALTRFPDDVTLLKLRGEALSLQRPEGEERHREFIRQAERLLAEGHHAAALALVDEALQRVAGHPALTALRDQIRERQVAEQRLAQQLASCAAQVPDAAAPPTVRIKGLSAAVDCYRQLGPSPGMQQALERLLPALAAGFDAALAVAEIAPAEQALSVLENLCSAADARPASAAELCRTVATRRTRLQERKALVPALIALPGGCFTMGSPAEEDARTEDEKLHQVCVKPFALAAHEVKIADFARFVKETGYRTDAERSAGNTPGCWAFDPQRGDQAWGYHPWANWRQPRKAPPVDYAEPVSCVSWHDAQAYLRWLNGKTGGNFRLPTEAEWEYAARAGVSGRWFWNDAAAACRYANIADTGSEWSNGFPCTDGFEWAAPSGRFAPNPWGFYDLFGNVTEWTCSEYDAHYRGDETRCAPPEATAPMVLRGGAWNSSPGGVRAAHRDRNYPEARYSFIGFRVARDLEPAAAGP